MIGVVINVYVDNWFFNNVLSPHYYGYDIKENLSEKALFFLKALLNFPGKQFLLAEMNKAELANHINFLPQELKNILLDKMISPGKDQIKALLENSYLKVEPAQYPHIFIGKNISVDLRQFVNDGINVIDFDKPLSMVSPDIVNGVKIVEWFKRFADDKPYSLIIIEDPFFLSKFKEASEIKSVFCFLTKIKAATLLIHCKLSGIREDNKWLQFFEVDKRNKFFIQCIQELNPNIHIIISNNAIHDRFISTNKEFFILGNSFNMRNDTSTYVAKFDLFEQGYQFFTS